MKGKLYTLKNIYVELIQHQDILFIIRDSILS